MLVMTEMSGPFSMVMLLAVVHTPIAADPDNPTPDETHAQAAWRLRAARSYAEIAL